MAPGGSISLSADDESSNVGGFNGATGTIQNGIELLFSGTADLGLNSAGISVSAFDKDIHSGVSRDGGCGPTDAYVLQGGCPTGGDTGDAFETTQAPGLLEFSHTPSGGAVPEPGSIILVGTGLLAMAGIVRRRSLNSR